MSSDHPEQSLVNWQAIQLSELSSTVSAHEERIKVLERFNDTVAHLTENLQLLDRATAPLIVAFNAEALRREVQSARRWEVWMMMAGGLMTIIALFIFGPPLQHAIQQALHIA